jgi:hypothetical protein
VANRKLQNFLSVARCFRRPTSCFLFPIPCSTKKNGPHLWGPICLGSLFTRDCRRQYTGVNASRLVDSLPGERITRRVGLPGLQFCLNYFLKNEGGQPPSCLPFGGCPLVSVRPLPSRLSFPEGICVCGAGAATPPAHQLQRTETLTIFIAGICWFQLSFTSSRIRRNSALPPGASGDAALTSRVSTYGSRM